MSVSGFVISALLFPIAIVIIYRVYSFFIEDSIEDSATKSKVTTSEKALIFLAKDASSATAVTAFLIILLAAIVFYFINHDKIENTTAVSVYISLIAFSVFLVKSLKDILKYYSKPPLSNDSDKLKEIKARKEAVYDFFGLLFTFLLTLFGIVAALIK